MKNWKQVGKQAWENKKTGFVVSYGNLNGVINGFKATTPETRKFETKEDAEDFLKEWMKNHPAPEKYESNIDYSKPENMTPGNRRKHHDKQQAAYEAEGNQ